MIQALNYIADCDLCSCNTFFLIDHIDNAQNTDSRVITEDDVTSRGSGPFALFGTEHGGGLRLVAQASPRPARLDTAPYCLWCR